MPEGSRRSLALIVLPYAVFAALWIVLSDWLLNLLVSDPRWMGQLQTYKGLAFVAITTLLLYFLVRRQQQRRDAVESERDRLRRRLLSMIESITDGFVALDRDWRYVYVNTRAAEMFGRRPEDLIGKHIWTEFPEGKGQPFHRAYERAVAEQKPVYLEDYYAPWDRWFENRIYPTPDGLTILFQDITERKRAERQRREDEERMRLMIRAANVGLFDWDLRENRVRYSPEWKRQLGYEDHEIKDDFSEWQSRIHPDDLERVLSTVRAYIEHPWPDNEFEFRLRHKNGSYRWILTHAALLRDEQGKPARMLGSYIDITERKRVEIELQESEQRYRAIFEQAAVGIARVALDGSWLEVNQNLCDIVGYARPELLTHTFQDITHPEDLDTDLAFKRRILAGEISVYSMEKRYLRKDGDIVWANLNVALVHEADGRPKYFVSVIKNITERKRAEDQLQERERRLSTLISNLPGAVFRVRNDSNYTAEYVSDQITALTGYPADDFRENRRNFSELMYPDDRAWVWNETQKALGEHRPYEVTYRFIDAHGREKWNWERGRGIFDANGELQAVEGFVQDITERKQAERQIAEYAQHLEQLSRRLLAAQEEERRRIARELHDQAGQALTALKITLQMPATATRRVESLALADDVLAQVRALSFDLRPSLLDDLGLAAALRAHAERLCKRAKLALRLDLADFETRPEGEVETACFRIAQEALTNVVRHAGATAVTITLQREGDAILLTVRDDGRGFDPARAADASLGLLGMRERAELAGGRLEVESAPGRGTAVRAWLPWRAREGLT